MNLPTSDFDTKLVELVRANPVLYARDLRTSPYDTMKKKIELWKSIAVSLEADTRYCITRWKTLRDRYRREVQRLKEIRSKSDSSKDSNWILYEKMRFLSSHIKYHHGQSSKRSPSHQQGDAWGVMEAESVVEEVYEDDPLQEAMDEQSNYEKDRGEAVTAAATSTTTSTLSQPVINFKRIETLLEGIDERNRVKAERRIVAYLCKCQLKSLNNEDIEDVVI